MTAPPDLSIDDAIDRWLERQQLQLAESSVASYRRRLEHFREWCDDTGHRHLHQLRPWDLGEYEDFRRPLVSAVSLNNELTTLRQFLGWADRLDLVREDVAEAVEPPTVAPTDEVRESMLSPERGEQLLRRHRIGSDREHALFCLMWWTGARLGAIRALDLANVQLADERVHFRHRPDSGTPLKNGRDGERVVGLSDGVADVLHHYINGDRPDASDDHGRAPLFSSEHGRLAGSTLRDTCYYATVPCRVEDCPHGRERPDCEFYGRTFAHGCPSSRSPHEVRSGSITWQLNRGLPAEVVAERVDASPDVIARHYDQAHELERYEERREQYLDQLDIDNNDP